MMVGDSVGDLPNDSGPLGLGRWGGHGREDGQSRYAGLGLPPSPLVMGMTPTCAGTILARECPGAGGKHLRGYG